MTEQEFLHKLEKDLEFEPETLQRGQRLVDLPLWDSMQQLVFIAKVEEYLGVVVEGEDVAKAKTVDDLLELAGDSLD